MNRKVALLDIGRRIVVDHLNNPAGEISVIEAVVDGLDEILPVLAAVAHVCEGILLDTREPSLSSAVEVTSDEVRRAAVESAFADEGSRRVEIRIASDHVDAFFPDVPEGGTSPGQEMVLSIVRALLHKDLDNHPLGIITLSEGPLDYSYRRGVWSAISNHFRGMPSTTLKTLVVAAESGIDIDLHCGTGTGFRFAIEGERLLVRNGRADLAVRARSLAATTEPFVLFLGAGFSASSRMPLGNRIRDDAIRRLLGIDLKEPLTSEELARRFHAWIAEKGWMNPIERSLAPDVYIENLTLEQVVRAEKRVNPAITSPTVLAFQEHHDRVLNAPGQAVHDLCRFLGSPTHRPIIVETNFDLLVEAHCSVPLKVFASDEDFLRAPDYLRGYIAGGENAVPVLKLHGSIDRPETCIVSTAQTEGGVGENKLAAIRCLREGEGRRQWIYVGTSMRDLDLRNVLREEDFARSVDEQWVEPYLSPGVQEFGMTRAPFWTDTGLPDIQDRLITETADAYFAAVRVALESGA